MAAWAIWVIGGATAAMAAGVCVWALVWDRSRGRLRCPRCWYSLDGGADMPIVCPECGRRIERARGLRRTRRRWRVASLAAGVAIAAAWVAPVWATRGGLAVVPAPSLRAVIDLVYAQEAMDAYQAALGAPLPESPWRQHLIAWGLAHDPPGPTIGPEDPFEDPSRWVSQHALARSLEQEEAGRLIGPEWREVLAATTHMQTKIDVFMHMADRAIEATEQGIQRDSERGAGEEQEGP